MKITITFKDPDGVSNAVDEAINSSRPANLTDDDWEIVKESREDNLDLEPWIKYMEYCTVEIDTEAKTATVIPNT